MKKVCFIILLISSIFLNACSKELRSKQPGSPETDKSSSAAFVGYVTRIENQRALVVSSVSKEINQTRKEFYDAVWVSNIPPNIKVGQNVHVSFEGEIATSYPAQGKASKVTISQIQKPEKATMSQDEVIRKALLNTDISSIRILVVKEVVYDEKSATWTMRYKDGKISDDPLEEHSIQIPDK